MTNLFLFSLQRQFLSLHHQLVYTQKNMYKNTLINSLSITTFTLYITNVVIFDFRVKWAWGKDYSWSKNCCYMQMHVSSPTNIAAEKNKRSLFIFKQIYIFDITVYLWLCWQKATVSRLLPGETSLRQQYTRVRRSRRHQERPETTQVKGQKWHSNSEMTDRFSWVTGWRRVTFKRNGRH